MKLTDALSKNMVLTSTPVLKRPLKEWEDKDDKDKYDDNGDLYRSYCVRCGGDFGGMWVMVLPDGAIMHDGCAETWDKGFEPIAIADAVYKEIAKMVDNCGSNVLRNMPIQKYHVSLDVGMCCWDWIIRVQPKNREDFKKEV